MLQIILFTQQKRIDIENQFIATKSEKSRGKDKLGVWD